jgi:hypothetical protein
MEKFPINFCLVYYAPKDFFHSSLNKLLYLLSIHNVDLYNIHLNVVMTFYRTSVDMTAVLQVVTELQIFAHFKVMTVDFLG